PLFIQRDWRDVAQRLRRDRFRMASTARRISRLDLRAQRCIERLFLDSDDGRLLGLRATTQTAQIFAGYFLLRPGTDVQANRGNTALCPAVIGLLAPSSSSFYPHRRSNLAESSSRKSSFDLSRNHLQPNHASGAA